MTPNQTTQDEKTLEERANDWWIANKENTFSLTEAFEAGWRESARLSAGVFQKERDRLRERVAKLREALETECVCIEGEMCSACMALAEDDEAEKG